MQKHHNPKKGNSVKRNRIRDDPSEHHTTDDEGNIDEKVIRKVKQHYRKTKNREKRENIEKELGRY